MLTVVHCRCMLTVACCRCMFYVALYVVRFSLEFSVGLFCFLLFVICCHYMWPQNSKGLMPLL